MRIQKILLIDDEPDLRRLFHQTLSRQGYNVICVSTVDQAEICLKEEPCDLVISDMMLPDGNGIEFLRRVRRDNPHTQAILITGFASTETAIDAIRIGLFDYLIKPVSPAQIAFSVQRLQSFEQLSSENSYLREQFEHISPTAPELWGRSSVMTEILELARRVAQTQAGVLIQGETGTGKELLARYIWQHSPRSQSPFVKINCASIPESLLESELFGLERGALDGAINRVEGRFETAHGGTLLLDEIAEIPLELQDKILKVLENHEFVRVGGTTPIQVDVRIIASTNRDLTEEIRLGNFRENLYYRLNVVPISLPPLRLRGNDTDELVNLFITQFSRRHGKDVKGLTEAAWAKIRAYPWPGNVRELQNTIERAIITSTPKEPDFYIDIPSFALPDIHESNGMVTSNGASAVTSPNPLDSITINADIQLPTVSEMERRLIAAALLQNNHNRTHAARRLGISLRTLRNKLRDYRYAGYDTTHPELWLT